MTDHVVGWLESFAAGYASETGECPELGSGEVPRAEAGDRITAAADRLDAALAHGAAERPLSIGGGAMPGDMALSMILAEYIVHGWDLARATGQPWHPDPGAVTASYEFLQGMVTPEYRGPDGMFGDEVAVSETADELTKLIGFTGRNPN
ncbi:TIGR03086 family metal-binding protein [Enemella sp. A6]|uniref:TIGR03086 family metal-binding protein n=1 Tax=Enemella sp. A6 TaxID=3440152 RepID=UPI003EC144B7